jgi:tRNA(adenine34) deaminase
MKKVKYTDIEWAMGEALKEAELASRNNEVPIGACVIDENGKVVSLAHNIKEKNNDPCGHAEVLAIQRACENIGDWRLNQFSLVVTLEPCLMFMGAIWQSRLAGVYFGAYDFKGGALSLNYNFHTDERLNHRFSVVGGVKHFECSKILSDFFKQKRKSYRFKNPHK